MFLMQTGGIWDVREIGLSGGVQMGMYVRKREGMLLDFDVISEGGGTQNTKP